MNANKIILPDFLIADLYKTSLADIDFSFEDEKSVHNPSPAQNETPALVEGTIIYTGENLKNITLIVNQPETTDINQDDFVFLTNVLKACELSVADVAIINITKQEITYSEIKNLLAPRQIVLFDAEPSLIRLPFIIPAFQVQNYADTAIMFAPALSTLNMPDKQGKLLKTKLWNSLKQLFSIS